MSPGAAIFAHRLYPGGWLVAQLYDFAGIERRIDKGSVETHPLKGVAAFKTFCDATRLDAWHQHSKPQRARTCAQAFLGAAAQAAVWVPTGAVAALMLGAVLLVRGKEAARRHAGEFFLPLVALIMATTAAGYIGCMLGGSLLLTGRMV